MPASDLTTAPAGPGPQSCKTELVRDEGLHSPERSQRVNNKIPSAQRGESGGADQTPTSCPDGHGGSQDRLTGRAALSHESEYHP